MDTLKKISKVLGLSRKKLSLLVVGLDYSGKSTLIKYLKAPKVKLHSIVLSITTE
jgi:GTPase SAR1 family protein